MLLLLLGLKLDLSLCLGLSLGLSLSLGLGMGVCLGLRVDLGLVVLRSRHGGLLLLQPHLIHLLFPLCSSQHLHCSREVCWVVDEGLDICDKERVKNVDNVLACRKLEGALVGNPNALEVHGADLDNVAHFFALENAVAAATRHPGHVEQLGAVDHVVVFAPRHTDALDFDLEAQRALVLPQRRRDTRLDVSRRWKLADGVL